MRCWLSMLYLSHGCTSAEFLPKLHSLVLTNNRLVNLVEIDPLASIPKLQYLSLLDNNITKKPNYRLYVIHKLKSLRVLDFIKIKAKVRTFLCVYPLSIFTYFRFPVKVTVFATMLTGANLNVIWKSGHLRAKIGLPFVLDSSEIASSVVLDSYDLVVSLCWYKNFHLFLQHLAKMVC